MPTSYLIALGALLTMAVGVWLLATARRNAGIVDIFWPLFFVAAAVVHFQGAEDPGVRAYLILGLILVWAGRLSVYLCVRAVGQPEDRRYQAIRARNEPGFAWKSLYVVFGLQAVLAWIVSAPLGGAVLSLARLNMLDLLGAGIVAFGIAFQAIADAQLAWFKADPRNRDRVLDTGLWKYSRHPNYFAEFCVWWGFYLIACAAGAWWSAFSPLLMTLLLLRVSGVALLEADIADRRPGYRDYVRRTNAFVPGPPRSP
jgi:steroid 5-alpha reductase family enzyme